MVKLKDKYQKEAVPAMMEKFDYRNKMAVPKVEKVVINTGFGGQVAGKSSAEREKVYQPILEDLSLICGQHPILTKAKKSIASFKIRQGVPIGAMVTLRKKKMYDFLERLINIGLPRSRDFQGIDPKSVDEQGNLTIAIKEHIAFPEVFAEKSKSIFGFEITVVTTAKSREEGLELFRLLGFPIKT